MDTSTYALGAAFSHSPAATARRENGETGGPDFHATFELAAAAVVEEETAAPEMTVQEYKQAFLAKVDAFGIAANLAGTRHSVTIAPELYEKMMNDPELEARVLGDIEETLTTPWPYAYAVPAFCAVSFDADGRYSASSGGSAHMEKYESMSANAAWRYEPDTTISSRDEEKKAAEAKLKKKKKLEKMLDDLALHRRESMRAMQQAYRQKLAGEADYVPGPEAVVRPSVLASFI